MRPKCGSSFNDDNDNDDDDDNVNDDDGVSFAGWRR